VFPTVGGFAAGFVDSTGATVFAGGAKTLFAVVAEYRETALVCASLFALT